MEKSATTTEQNATEQNTGGSNALGFFGDNEEVLAKPVPTAYKVGRDAQLQLARAERDLFTELEERQSGNYIVSGLERKVTELDLTAFSFAVAQALYNQSYQKGTTDTNSGLSQSVAPSISNRIGATQYVGDIAISLNDLCRLAYGVYEPDARQRKTMATLIDNLHNTPVKIRYPNGDELDSYLSTIQDKYTRKEDGAVLYHLHLNPIFCSNVKNNFGELPQDYTKRLSQVAKRKTLAHYKLSRLLSIQSRNKPFVRTIEELVNELSLHDAYKINRGRTESQLLAVCDDLISVGMLESYEVERTSVRNKQAISRIVFHLSLRERLLGNN